jgi:methylmalonyl-CoA epimerase
MEARARGVHHVGIAVADLDQAIATYTSLFGAELELHTRVDEQGLEAAGLRLGEGRVELLTPLADETPVGKFLAKRGPGMHHVAYAVDDIRAALAELKADGVQLVDEEPRQGVFGHEIAFLHPDAVHGVLTEVVADG